MEEISIYFQIGINKVRNDPVMIYSLLFTTYNAIIYNIKEKPNKINLSISYVISLWMRYNFYPFYFITDTLDTLYKTSLLLNNNKIRIL